MALLQTRVPIERALDMELYKDTLRQRLVDDAERDLKLWQAEGHIAVTVEGTDFVATFHPLEATA